MITKKSSATIDKGSQKSRACTNWRRSVRAIVHACDDGPLRLIAHAVRLPRCGW